MFHYLYSLKHTPSYDFTEDGIVPLKREYLDYNTNYKDATKISLGEMSSSTFSISCISSYVISNIFSCVLWELELFCYGSSLRKLLQRNVWFCLRISCAVIETNWHPKVFKYDTLKCSGKSRFWILLQHHIGLQEDNSYGVSQGI